MDTKTLEAAAKLALKKGDAVLAKQLRLEILKRLRKEKV